MTTGRSILRAKFRRLAAQFPYIPQALRLVWSAAPRQASLWAVLLVFQGLLPIGAVYLTGLACYDNAEFYDHLHRARAEAGSRPVALLDNPGGILQNSITLVSMLAVLAPFGLWLPGALLASTLPALYVVLRHALDQHYWRMRTTADERRTWYYDWVLTAVDTAAEVRLFSLGDHFQSALQTLRAKLREERLRLVGKQGAAELLAGLFALAAAGAALVWMTWRAFRHEVTLGDLAMFFQAFQQGLRLSRSLLDDAGPLYANTLFLGNLFDFLALEPKELNPARARALPALRQAIRFRGVSFRYRGASRLALRDLDLEIPAGRITAAVGSNGGGEEHPHQAPVPFLHNATVAENIALGDIAPAPDRAAIQTAAEAAGAGEIVRNLPSGYDHLLGRWARERNGAERRGVQRTALARAFLRQAPILVLDEPGSAMDPWAESDWLRRFRQLAAGRTTEGDHPSILQRQNRGHDPRNVRGTGGRTGIAR